MTYDKAVEEYLKLRVKIDKINAKAKKDAAEFKKQMVMLENWITMQADKEGLENVPTPHGTAYWSIHKRCSVANPEEFFTYVVGNQRWDLMEKRASKIAVGQEVDDTGAPPPGVNYSTVKVFNVRSAHSENVA